MNKKKCPNIAIYLVPWAGSIMSLCVVHAKGMSALGAVIGSPIQIRPLGGENDEQCQGPDDLEEYKKAELEI